ncbi:MAG: hypothetical protein Q7R99_04065 [bacterium]|nr:hypothetical protein [bacterium]
MAKGVKIFLGILLAVNIIFSANFALGADDKSKQLFSPFELSYPNIPGLGRLSDYQNVTTSQQVGFIISYIFKLVFFISIGAGLVALIASGVLYIVSSSRPKYLTTAKQMANNAMLGLFILICASLLLYVINPQLLSLTLQKPELKNIELGTANQYDPDTIVVQKVSFTSDLIGAIDNLEEMVYFDSQGRYIEKLGEKFCYTDGYGGPTDNELGEDRKYLRDLPEGNADKTAGCVTPPPPVNEGNFFYRAEIPLRETAEALEIITPLAKELSALLDRCKCGQSFGWSDWSASSPGCKPGKNPAEFPATVKENTESGNYCLNQADNCGSARRTVGGGSQFFLECDLRDVRKNIDTGKIEVCMKDNMSGVVTAMPVACTKDDPINCWVSIDEINSSFLPSKFISPKAGCGLLGAMINNQPPEVFSLIKLKILKIQEQQAKMQARSKIDTRFLDSATLIGNALRINAIEFATSQAKGEWAYGFADDLKKWQSAGYNVVIQDANNVGDTNAPAPKAFNTKSDKGFLARLKTFFSPFSSITSKLVTGFALAQDKSSYFAEYAGTFFYITQAPEGVQSKDVTDKNEAISRDSRRYSLFSLLTDLPLEGIEGIFRDCLASAFGKADYQLNEKQIQDVAKAVMDSEAGEHYKAAIRNKIDEIAKASVDGTGQVIADDATISFVKKYLTQCAEAGCSATDVDAQEYMDKLFGVDKSKRCSVVTDTCCYCVKNLMSNGVPPNYLSKTFSNLFSTNLDSQLPYISNLLDRSIIETLFPANERISQVLNGPMLNVYDAVFKNVLKEDFNKQIPGLDTLLNKQMEDVLPDFMVDQVTKINAWFENAVSSTKSLAKSASDKLATGLVDEFVAQPMHEWAQNQFDKLGIGTEHLTIGECFRNLERGYIYTANNGKTDKNSFILDAQNYNKNPDGREPGKCLKMTLGQINQVYKADLEVPQRFNYVNSEDINSKIIEHSNPGPVEYLDGMMAELSSPAQTICENAGYTWESPINGGSGCWKKDDIGKGAKAAVDTISDIHKTGTYIAGGLVSYAEKLSVAFAETALQFALAYARVFVEDNFITPLLGYWNTISGFQQGMENFLTTSVKQLLPAQISGFLQSNISEQLTQFCDKYNDPSTKKYGPDTENGDCPANSAEITGECTQIDLVFTLSSGVTWKGSDKVVQTVTVPKETGDAICRLEKHLATTPWEEITMMCEKESGGEFKRKNLSEFEKRLCNNVIDTLKAPLNEALQNVCEKVAGASVDECNINKLFAKPLVSMFFPHLPFATIDAFINGTPKNLICGDLPVLSGGVKATTLCAGAFDNKFGFFPVVKDGLSKAQKDIMPWCFFINYACKNPLTLSSGDSTVGGFIKSSVNASCNVLDDQLSKGADSTCKSNIGECFGQYYYPKGNILNGGCEVEKGACNFCNTLAKNSVFYTLIYEGVEHSIGARNGDPQKLKLEKEFYAQMLNSFGELSGDIRAVANNRGLTGADWAEVLALVPLPKDLLKNMVDGNFSNIFKIAIKLAGYSIEEPSLKDVLNKDENLGKTPFAVLRDKVCIDAIKNFESKYSEYTLESLEATDVVNSIRTALPYSLESVETVSFAEVVKAFGNTDVGKSEIGQAYLLCKVLDKTPQEIAGLDFPLKSYIKPDEFKIMFELLDETLSEGSEADCRDNEDFFFENGQAMCCDPTMGIGRGLCYKVGEKPAGLNLLLDYMNNKTPISALEDVQQKLNHPGEAFPLTLLVYDQYGCLKVNKTIREGCSGTIPSVFDNVGFNSVVDIIKPIEAADPDIVITEGMKVRAFGKIHKDKIVSGMTFNIDYFLYRDVSSNLVFVFQGANQVARKFSQVLGFMQTPIGDIIDKALGKNTLADYICNEVDLVIPGLCDEKISENWNIALNRKKIIDILKATPVDLAAQYLRKPLSLPDMFNCHPKPFGGCKTGERLKTNVLSSLNDDECCVDLGDNGSIMDAMAANTALGQPLIDTFGALTGLDAVFKSKIADPLEQARSWAESGAKAGVKAIQNGLDNALVDWPASMAPKWLAEFYGFNVGKQTATDIAGSCYNVESTTASCKDPTNEILKDKGTDKAQCCILARGRSCQPRCREVDLKEKQCNVLAGEMANPIRIPGNTTANACCFGGVLTLNDKTPVGFWLNGEPTVDGTCEEKPAEGCPEGKIINPKNSNQCCSPQIKFCQKARAVNFDAGAKCRAKDENAQTYEVRDDELGACVFFEEYQQTLPPIPSTLNPTVEDMGFCCSTVSQCITNKLSSHIETLAEMIADGNIPLQSLKK